MLCTVPATPTVEQGVAGLEVLYGRLAFAVSAAYGPYGEPAVVHSKVSSSRPGKLPAGLAVPKQTVQLDETSKVIVPGETVLSAAGGMSITVLVGIYKSPGFLRILGAFYLLLLVKLGIGYESRKFRIALSFIDGEALLYRLLHL